MKKLPPNAPTYTAAALVGLGVILIFMAWDGAASFAYVPAQIPYMVSGGLGGLALVGAGLVLVRVAEARKDNAELRSRLDELTLAVRELGQTRAAGVSHALPTPATTAPNGSSPSQTAEDVTVDSEATATARSDTPDAGETVPAVDPEPTPVVPAPTSVVPKPDFEEPPR